MTLPMLEKQENRWAWLVGGQLFVPETLLGSGACGRGGEVRAAPS